MDEFKKILNEISHLFEYEYNDSFFEFLKSISKPNNQVCNKAVKNGEGAYKCLDCEIDSLSLICCDCFNKHKDKHKGHRVVFHPENYGYCDCGDPNTLKKEGFCSEHQGPFTNEKSILDFIQSCLTIDINKLIPILNKIFLLFIDKINQMNNEKEVMDELFKMIDYFYELCSKLYKNNLGFFYLVVLKCTENFPFETKHKCFKYNEKEKLITIIEESDTESHTCVCPFFQILINILLLHKNEENSDNFFSLFIQNYKNKIITGISYFHSFIQLHLNDNLTTFRGMAYQLLSDDLSILICDEKNKFFLENVFKECYNTIEELINNEEEYDTIQNIIYDILIVLKYLPKVQIQDKISSNLNIYDVIINISSLFNNLNIFEDKINYNLYQREGCNINLLNCEIFILLIHETLSLLLDYNNENNVKHIFEILISKLNDFKESKENKPKIFSFHITLIRIYSIYLNRFCFHYSFKNNCDLLESFQYFQKLIPDSLKLNKFLFNELLNVFSFLIAQKYSFFSYFGEGMVLYYRNYFSSRIYILCDITLMKYLLSILETSEINLLNILFASKIDTIFDFFLNEFILHKEDDVIKKKNEEFANKIKQNQKCLQFVNSILEFFLQIIRDNTSMIHLSFKFSDMFRMKYTDQILENLMKNEENFKEIIKNEIFLFILGNKNLISREQCIKGYQIYKDYFTIDDIDKILSDNCEEILYSNQLKRFSLKKSFFYLCDLDYIIDYNQRTNAFKYMIDFKPNNYSLLNTYFAPTLSIQKELNQKIYDNFFNSYNFEIFNNFFNFLLINEHYLELNDIFMYIISKFICIYIKLHQDNKNDNKKNIIIQSIKNHKLENTNFIEYINYIKKLLYNEEEVEKNENEKHKVLTSTMSLKNKFKKKFIQKNQDFLNKYSNENLDLDDEKNINEDICIFCRLHLNKNDLDKYYGKICYKFSDYFNDILIKKPQNQRKKTTRFVTCNHKIHFECYNTFIVQVYVNNNNLQKGFSCPLCKKLSNIIICDFNSLIKNNKDFLKGLTFNNDNLDNFYIEDISNNFIQPNINIFEDYLSKAFKKKDFLIKDLNSENDYIERLYNSILKDFNSFINYYSITNYKNEQLEIWKNFLLTIRFLCKSKTINLIDILISKFKEIYKNFEEFNFSYFNNLEITYYVDGLIICLFILYELNEKDKEKIKNFFKNHILIYYYIYPYLKNKETNFNEYLEKKENEDLFKKIFFLYNLKYKICFLFYDEKEENLNLNYDELINSMKNNENIKKLLSNYDNYIKENPNSILQEQIFEIPQFNIIDLPENFLEFSSNYSNQQCVNCKKKNANSYICLICGSKLCNLKTCQTEINNDGKKEYSLIAHSKKCSGGNTLYLSIINSEIIYLYKRQFIFPKIYIYLNSFGEYKKESYLTSEFILNKIELEKAINSFIDMTFRQRTYRILNIPFFNIINP